LTEFEGYLDSSALREAAPVIVQWCHKNGVELLIVTTKSVEQLNLPASTAEVIKKGSVANILPPPGKEFERFLSNLLEKKEINLPQKLVKQITSRVRSLADLRSVVRSLEVQVANIGSASPELVESLLVARGLLAPG